MIDTFFWRFGDVVQACFIYTGLHWLGFEIRPSNLFSIELFAYTPVPEWGGAKLRIPLEDDAIVTERGVEWLYPINRRILLIG